MKKNLKISAILLLLFLNSCTSIDNSTKNSTASVIKSKIQKVTVLNNFINLPTMKNASVGVKVVDLNSDKVLLNINSTKTFTPASNLKLLTSSAALIILGSDFRFKTTLAYSGKIKNGVLTGNIYIIGGGDPTLGSKYIVSEDGDRITPHERDLQLNFLKIWVKKIKALGIRKIDGKIIADNSNYPKLTLPQSWEWGDLHYTFASYPNGLSFFDNSMQLTLHSKKNSMKTTVSLYPSSVNTRVTNRVIRNDKKPNNTILVVVPYSNQIITMGSIKKSSITYNTVMQDPAAALVKIFAKTLKESGIKSNGYLVNSNPSKLTSKKKIFYVNYSPKLKDIITYTDKYSVNLFAEHLKLEIEKKLARRSGIDKNALKAFWQQHISAEGLYISDGSGLSRHDGVTPDTLVNLLTYMKKTDYFLDFYNSLSEPGKPGRLYQFKKDTVLYNNLHAKTGTLTGIKSCSGYMYNKDGNLMAFSIMINHHGMSGSAISKEIEKLLEKIYYLK